MQLVKIMLIELNCAHNFNITILKVLWRFGERKEILMTQIIYSIIFNPINLKI